MGELFLFLHLLSFISTFNFNFISCENLVFTLFNIVSLPDLSGILGGILGGESMAGALEERGGRCGGGQISAMSFKKTKKQNQ